VGTDKRLILTYGLITQKVALMPLEAQTRALRHATTRHHGGLNVVDNYLSALGEH
jgi:hypothetical protein